ncbi:MAG: M28 family metallopeptidase [Myxococcota bacterium]
MHRLSRLRALTSLLPMGAASVLLGSCAPRLQAQDWVRELYGPQSELRTQLDADLAELAAPEREGRLPASEADVSTRNWLESRFAEIGLATAGAGDTYGQPFITEAEQSTANVLGRLQGTDDSLANQIIVVSAHHDHLGPGFPGANDNASGIAALLSIAQILAKSPLKRPVLFALLGSEESGFEGAYFATSNADGLDVEQVVYNVNLDMVGSLSMRGRLWAFGSHRDTLGRTLIDEATQDWPNGVVRRGFGSRLSDNVAFCERGIPYVFLWTPDPDCYHGACDTFERLDRDGLAAVVQVSVQVVRALGDANDNLAAGVLDKDVCKRAP